jgi:hypothetical protein
VLGVAFVLVEDLRIIVQRNQHPVPGSAPRVSFHAHARLDGVKRTRKHWLSRELRGKLFYAHAFLHDHERQLEILDQVPRYRRKVKKLRKTIDPASIAEIENDIGPAWSYILRHTPYTCSGLSVAGLARVLGKSLSWWYDAIYPFQSRAVHANDFMKHLEVIDGRVGPTFLSKPFHVYESLRTAMTMFFVHLRVLHGNIGFGPEVDVGYDSLKRKMDRLAWRGA